MHAPAPAKTFPPFSLTRLLTTVFEPKGGERVAIMIDLEDPTEVLNFDFLKDPTLTIQKHAYEVFYQGFQNGALKELKMTGGDFYAYQITGGSNLDLPDLAITPRGQEGQFGEGCLSELRLDSLYLDLLGNGSPHRVCEAVWLPRRNAAWTQRDHFEQRPGGRLQRGEQDGGEVAPGPDEGRLVRGRFQGRRRNLHR